jgi:hypothetical protein
METMEAIKTLPQHFLARNSLFQTLAASAPADGALHQESPPGDVGRGQTPLGFDDVSMPATRQRICRADDSANDPEDDKSHNDAVPAK